MTTIDYLPHNQKYCRGDFIEIYKAGDNSLIPCVCEACGKLYFPTGKDTYYDPDTKVTYKPVYKTVQVLKEYEIVNESM